MDKLMAFMAEHATRSPAASSPPPPPPFAQRFREVRALRGARALRALAAAPLLAYVRYDPVECGAACAELDGPWETAATFDVPGGVWHVACAEERQLCASRVADRRRDSRERPAALLRRRTVSPAAGPHSTHVDRSCSGQRPR